MREYLSSTLLHFIQNKFNECLTDPKIIFMVAIMDLKSYLKLTRKAVEQASSELNVSRQTVHNWMNGKRADPNQALKVEKWSNGAVPKETLLYPE